MSVFLKVGKNNYEVGNPQILHGFFSTVAYYLEPIGWGSKYPVIMNELYPGNVSSRSVEKGIKELNMIREKLSHLKPEQVIWDVDGSAVCEDEGEQTNKDAKNIAEFFLTNEGRALIDVISESFEQAQRDDIGVEII